MDLRTTLQSGNLRKAAMLCACVFAVTAMTQTAQAEFFTFSTTVNPTVTITPGGATITLTPESVNTPGDNLDATPAGTDIVYGDIAVTGVTRTSQLDLINIPYTFHVTISNYATDLSNVPTGPPVLFDISGTLTGSVGPGKKVNIANSFSQTSITQLVGGENYQLSLFSYVAPGIVNSGAFGAHVEVVRVPEPASIALLGLGCLALATPAYRRWRGRQAVAV